MLRKTWLAGYFDGEGSIWISKYKNMFLPRVSIAQSDKRSLEEICKIYGGYIDKWISKVNGKTVFHWVVRNGEEVRGLLEDIFPYLREKKVQAELMLAFLNTNWRQTGRGGIRKKRTEEEIGADELFYRAIKIAKPRYWQDYGQFNNDEELIDYIFGEIIKN